MTNKQLNIKLNNLINTPVTNSTTDEIYNTCFDYLFNLTNDERLTFMLEDSFYEDSRPKNMSKKLLDGVINKLNFNPFNPDYWSFIDLDKFIDRHFTQHEDIELDSFNSLDPKTLVNEILKKVTKKDVDYLIEFEYEVGDHELFTGHVFYGPDGNIHTLVYYDEQNGVEIDEFTLDGIVECYLETK